MARNKSALTVVEPDPDIPPPPAGLDEVGAALWQEILATWHWDDPVPLRVLREACVALQTAEQECPNRLSQRDDSVCEQWAEF